METKILIVEDEAIIAEDMKTSLQGINYQVTGIASSGREALRAVATNIPDLILMDIKLYGDMDGIEVTERIHRDHDIPVVYLTAFADEETLGRVKRSGPFGYVIKPVDNRELRTAVEMALYRHHMEIRLKREKEKAEAADRAKTEFLANISHELKTPMNGILGLTDLVLESALPETQLQLLEMVKASGLSLLAVINDILEFSMLHSDKVVLNNVPFELREILKMSVQAFRAEAQRKDIHLELRISPHVPPMVYGDPARLRQVLFSLVGNAVKFTEKGKVHVEVLAPPASDLHKNNSIVFKISDTGIGIPENKLEAIFNSFTQADGSFTRQHGGAGLGLAICYRLVKLMDGEILVESKEGNGSTFSFNAHFAYEHNGKIHENTDS